VKMKFRKSHLFFIAGLYIFLLTGCWGRFPQVETPNDVVYMSDGPNEYFQLVFLNANDGAKTEAPLNAKFEVPSWSGIDSLMFGLSGKQNTGHFGGYPAFWNLETGKFKVCDNNLALFLKIQGMDDPERSKEAIVQNLGEIRIIDLATCETQKMIVDYWEKPHLYRILGFSYNPYSESLLYGLIQFEGSEISASIIQRDINSGEEIVIGDGVNPSWSNEYEEIAFNNIEGALFVMNSDGTDVQRILVEPLFNPISEKMPSNIPFVQWAFNGRGLLYHRCQDRETNLNNCNVYLLDIESQEESLLAKKGMYPIWIDR